MKIILVGGGTGGSVSPLLAVHEQIKKMHPPAKFLFIGSKNGPEQVMAKEANIGFVTITAGKLKRYFSLSNFLSPFLVIIGFSQSHKLLKSYKPDVIFGTGSFVQVPVIWAAYFLGVPCVLHQQDLYPSLANKLCQFTAKKITVTFEDSVKDFSTGLGLFYAKRVDKVVLTGNPFREEFANIPREDGLKAFDLKNNLPVLLVIGGGTGAQALNKLIWEALPSLSKYVQIIHVAGRGKSKTSTSDSENYREFEFLKNMGEAYAAADIVLCRAGLSTITELSNLKKVSIIIPMPESHQELNAFLLYQQKAGIVLDQRDLKPENLAQLIRKLLFNLPLQKDLQENISKIMPRHASKKIATIILKEISF